MLSLTPKTNERITVADTLTGNRWELWLYYKKGSRELSLAFDAPSNIIITTDKKSRKDASNEQGQ